MKKEILIPATRFADPTVDFAFKRIFGTEKYKDATINLLNGLIPELDIRDIAFLNNEIISDTLDSKKSVIDIRAEDSAGRQFIIEMQRASQSHFMERTLYYASRVISLMGQAGCDYIIEPVYVVSLMNFSMEKLNLPLSGGKYMMHYRVSDTDSGEKMPGGPEFFFFSLPDFKKAEGELLSIQENWIYLLSNSKNFKEIPRRYRDDPRFRAYFEASSRASFSKAEEDQYTKDMMTQRDIENSKREACERAKAEGAAEKSREVARKMKERGLDANTISDCTGLSADEIKAL